MGGALPETLVRAILVFNLKKKKKWNPSPPPLFIIRNFSLSGVGGGWGIFALNLLVTFRCGTGRIFHSVSTPKMIVENSLITVTVFDFYVLG